MNFSEALTALKEGKKIKREKWSGYWRLYLHAQIHGTNPANGNSTYCEPGKIIIEKSDDGITVVSATQPDILAEDWEIVD